MSRYNKEYQKKYREEHREQLKDNWKKWYAQNREKHIANNKEYVENNPERTSYNQRKYNFTKEGRANKLLTGYKTADKKYNREGFNLTQSFILDRIFASSCIYCGETDWRELGCDRIDNNKAHTTDNVVCACKSCNNLRQKKDFKTFLLSQNPTSASDILSNLGLS